jgi:hypothetical protein
MTSHPHARYAIGALKRHEYLVEAARERLIDQHYPSAAATKGERLHRLDRARRRVIAATRSNRFMTPLASLG